MQQASMVLFLLLFIKLPACVIDILPYVFLRRRCIKIEADADTFPFVGINHKLAGRRRQVVFKAFRQTQ